MDLHGTSLSLNLFILHHVFTTYTNLFGTCFLETTPVLAPNVWANENPKVDTRSWESNLGPYDCEVDALPHDHRHPGTEQMKRVEPVL